MKYEFMIEVVAYNKMKIFKYVFLTFLLYVFYLFYQAE
jgi:hypothetical protein